MFLNHSRASLFRQCQRKYALSYVIGGGYKPETEPEHFRVGLAVHAGMEILALNQPDAAQRAVDHYSYSRSKKWNNVLLEEWKETSDLVRRMVQGYQDQAWPKHDFTIINAERKFSVPLGEVCYKCGEPYLGQTPLDDFPLMCHSCGATIHQWVGIIDLLVNRKGNGPHDRFGILDHKTTASTPNDQFLDTFARSFQLIGYVYGAEKESGLAIREYGVNALQKAKTIGTEQAEIKTCTACRNGKIKVKTCTTCNMTGKVEKKIKLEPFRRKWFTVDDSDIDRFVLWAHRTVIDIERETELLKTEPEIAFPMNDKVCSFCLPEFREICWSNRNALKWYEPPEELLGGLKPRGTDYVDAHEIAAEEVS